jgi:hypothetical protein
VTLKDEDLARLAGQYNVAAFVSFSPDLDQGARFGAIRGAQVDLRGISWREAAEQVLETSTEGCVNVRTFRRDQASGNPFLYGIDDLAELEAVVQEQAAAGYFTIVNETVSVDDGGVSGVAHGEVMEFAHGATPRAVEGQNHVTLPISLGKCILETVYGFEIDLGSTSERRVEFSVHPLRVGVQHGHTLVWEVAHLPSPHLDVDVHWPNQFSRLIGDKVFGLLVAHGLGLSVPRTTVLGRRVAPFTFGRTTGTSETWIRTVPVERTPGRFTTARGWLDPYKLMVREDPGGERIASVLAQAGVDALFSGATLSTQADGPVIEGVPGYGDQFMQGTQPPSALPSRVVKDVAEAWDSMRKHLPAPSFEWVHDGHEVWIVQLHADRSVSSAHVIAAGEPRGGWVDFNPDDGLDVLRTLVDAARQSERGIRVTGPVGVTSHVGDILRAAGIPSVVARS